MERQAIIFRGMVGLIGASTAAALAIRNDREAAYLAARQDFDATCAESERLLAEAECNIEAARQLGPS